MPCRNSLDHKDNRSCKDEEQRLQCGIEVLIKMTLSRKDDTRDKVVKRYSEGESKQLGKR